MQGSPVHLFIGWWGLGEWESFGGFPYTKDFFSTFRLFLRWFRMKEWLWRLNTHWFLWFEFSNLILHLLQIVSGEGNGDTHCVYFELGCSWGTEQCWRISYPLNLCQARHAHYLQISAVYFDPVSTAVAYKCIANNDTENVTYILIDPALQRCHHLEGPRSFCGRVGIQ